MSTCPFISSREFNSQTSELRTNVHGQSCHLVNQRGSKISSQVGTVDDSNIPGSWKFVKTWEGANPCVFTGMMVSSAFIFYLFLSCFLFSF